MAGVRPRTPELLASLGHTGEIDAGSGRVLASGDQSRLALGYPPCRSGSPAPALAATQTPRAGGKYLADGKRFRGTSCVTRDHGDANDHNVLVRDGRVVAILDLGDSVYTATVCDLAIRGAYAMLDQPTRWPRRR